MKFEKKINVALNKAIGEHRYGKNKKKKFVSNDSKYTRVQKVCEKFNLRQVESTKIVFHDELHGEFLHSHEYYGYTSVTRDKDTGNNWFYWKKIYVFHAEDALLFQLQFCGTTL